MTEQLQTKASQLTPIINFLRLFVLAYLFFYMFPFPLSNIPYVSEVFGYYDKAIEALTLGIGKTILKIKTLEKVAMTGSGDTRYDYVKLISIAVIALISAIVIVAFSARKSKHKKLYEIVFTYARYYLGLYMLVYGFAKIYGGQFGFPDLGRLEQKFGDASPMGLLWTFMGFSKSYTIFTGLSEIIAGALLFFRRTTVFGALLTLLVMSNVTMLNFAYDVPVKLFSSHLTLISIFILSRNIINLIRFFITNKTTALHIEKLELTKKWLRWGRIALKFLVVIGLPALLVYSYMGNNNGTPKNNLAAAYFTEEFFKNADTLPPGKNDSIRWSKFFISEFYSQVFFANEQSTYYDTKIDTVAKTLKLKSYADTNQVFTLNYAFTNDNRFTISGLFRSDSISANFKVKRLEDYLLVKRGFHWINEYPFNR